MTRRAFFEHGSGLLLVDPQRLVFIADSEHPAADSILQAAQAERPMRAAAAAVARAQFEVPAFVLGVIDESRDTLQGMVVGDLLVLVGAGAREVHGQSVEPWATFDAQLGDALSVGGAALDALAHSWASQGLVRAGAFSWTATTAPQEAPQAAPRPTPATEPAPPPAPESGPEPEPEPLPDTDTDTDGMPGGPTIDGPTIDGPTVGGEPAVGTDQHVNELPIAGQIESVQCTSCHTANALSVARCGGCGQLLGDDNSARVWIDQPALGTLVFSDDQIETLDATLLIGRNPAPDGCPAGRRAVVVGADDLTVSRRHIMIQQDGWAALVTNLKEGHGTMIEKPSGAAVNLDLDVPTELAPGDTVLFGSCWLRYEHNT